MDARARTTNFAEIGAGFLAGLNVMTPLIRGLVEYQEGNPPPSMFLQLKNPEKRIFIAPGEEPTVVELDSDKPDANFSVVVDAEMFHYLIWGKLPFAKAINEKVVLVESQRSAPPEDQPVSEATGGPLLFNNFLYEMYLIRIGADRLITENTKPEIPLPGEQRPIKDIPLDPVPGKTFLGAVANAMARMLGWLLGLLLPSIIKWQSKEDLEAPIEYSTIPDPRPPIPPPSSGARLALMRFLFRRIDIFSVMENLAKGAVATGPFKKKT